MQPKLPGIPIGLDHLRLAGHGVVVPVLDVAPAHEGLEVGAEFHAIGWVHVDHLHLAAQLLVGQERIHHHQGVAQDQPVAPAAGVLVGIEQLLVQGSVLLAEEAEQVQLAARPVALDGLEDGLGGQPLVHEQRQGRHLEAEPLGLAGPVQEGPGLGPERFGRGSGLVELGVRQPAQALGEVRVAAVGRGRRDALDLGAGALEPGEDLRESRLPQLPRRVLPVPVQRRGQRVVVAIPAR